MGKLDEPRLDALVAAGCTACGHKRLLFRSYLDAHLPLMGGEPVGTYTWAYDGEKFIDGVFEVTCASCQHVMFTDGDCPRCHAVGLLQTALASTNRWPAPRVCGACDGEEFRFTAMVPARVAYEGRRAEKPHTTTEMHEAGFHAYAATCLDCGEASLANGACPLCDQPGPLRERP